MGHANQGIVHVIGPEQGLTQPGITIVCGDSHTSTHGAFGALAFGIGTSEVEHVLATQTLTQRRPKTMAVTLEGDLAAGVTAKDIVLAIVGRLGTTGGAGHVIEYRGSVIESLSMEGRMTVCNMSIEAGARAGMVAPDDVTFAYLEGRPYSPKGVAWERGPRAVAGAPERRRRRLRHRDLPRPFHADAARLMGDEPGPGRPDRRRGAEPRLARHARRARSRRPGTRYMGLAAGTAMRDVAVDTVFIGSCTNARIEDLRAAAAVLEGRSVRSGLRALVVPGSAHVKRAAEGEGLDEVFRRAGFEWRESGCSMCLGMNPDQLKPGERCASTSNRNFEGRQGRGGRTHLVSPAVAAATAVIGRFATPDDLEDA